jgi:hypothetical protein
MQRKRGQRHERVFPIIGGGGVSCQLVEKVESRRRLVEEEEEEGAQLFLWLLWAWVLLLARALLPLIGARLRTKATAWVGVGQD